MKTSKDVHARRIFPQVNKAPKTHMLPSGSHGCTWCKTTLTNKKINVHVAVVRGVCRNALLPCRQSVFSPLVAVLNSNTFAYLWFEFGTISSVILREGLSCCHLESGVCGPCAHGRGHTQGCPPAAWCQPFRRDGISSIFPRGYSIRTTHALCQMTNPQLIVRRVHHKKNELPTAGAAGAYTASGCHRPEQHLPSPALTQNKLGDAASLLYKLVMEANLVVIFQTQWLHIQNGRTSPPCRS